MQVLPITGIEHIADALSTRISHHHSNYLFLKPSSDCCGHSELL